MRDFVTIDASSFPFVVAKYQPFVPTTAEFVKAQEDLAQAIASHNNFVLLVDFSVMPYLPTEYRISHAKWSQKHKETHVRHQMRVVFYTTSLMHQLLLRGVFAVSAPGVPYYVTSSMKKAKAWAEKQLAVPF